MRASGFWLLALLGLSAAHQASDVAELRRALDAMRGGSPGEPAFDAALEHLPALIESGSGWFVESGAYLAGRHGRGECVPALLAALEQENRRPPAYADDPKRSILDALILLGADVPAALLTERLEESSLAETYLLLARDTEHGADGLVALLEAAPKDHVARWAAAAALVAASDRRVARQLLLGTEWELDVVVADDDAVSPNLYSGWGGRWSAAHEIWPPHVTYELLLPAAGEPLLPIQHRRTEATRSGAMPKPVLAWERPAWRTRLLGELLGASEERELLASPDLILDDAENAEAYREALRAHCAGLRERLGRVAARLERSGLLENAADVAAAVQLRVRLHDRRTERQTPLPTPPDLAGVVFEGPRAAQPAK